MNRKIRNFSMRQFTALFETYDSRQPQSLAPILQQSPYILDAELEIINIAEQHFP
jgi:hypothetical protein